MNRITSLIQIKNYKARPLLEASHKELAKTIKFFSPDQMYNRLSWTYWFKKEDYSMVLEKMNRIGWAADEIQHHPEWTLGAQTLHINLSTHDIGNRVSLKDYILAVYIETLLLDSNPEKQLQNAWNKKNLSLTSLKEVPVAL